jgi:nucleoside-diphosphate-sugar epimerase
MPSPEPARRSPVELPPAVTVEEATALCQGIVPPVAVTGGTGLVGSHLVDAMVAAGVRPRVLVRDPARLEPSVRGEVEIVRGDLSSQEVLTYLVGGCRTVVHCAALIRAADEESFEAVNWHGTQNLVTAMESRGRAARLVHVSSLAALGPSPDPAGRSPDDVAAPVSAYGRSKLAGEVTVKSYADAWCIVRPPAIYGPRDIDIFQFFRMAARGRVTIPAGDRFLTLVHVSDVVRALLAAAGGRATGRVVHLGEPETRRLDLLAGMLGETGGVSVKVIHVAPFLVRAAGAIGNLLQRFGVSDVAMTSDKAQELLACHWTARTEESRELLGLEGWVPFRTGAAATWQWYRDRGWLPHAKMPVG